MRLTLLDKLKLRKTSVYSSPKEISTLRIPYGDLTNVQIPCIQIDAGSKIYHISDVPIQLISAVYVDGEPINYGFKSLTSYQDETGKAIACVIFDNPQYEKAVTVSCKGAINLDTGRLIESPAGFIKHVFLKVQGYDETAIDTAELSDFYAICLKYGIMIGCLLEDADMTIKALLDELAFNIHAHWILSDGKSKTRLRNADLEGVPYPFTQNEITSLSMTSEELINEITLKYNYSWAESKFLSSITKHNPISKKVNETVQQSYECKMLYSTRQAERTIDSMLKSYSFPSILASFKHNLKSLAVEPGDPCTITHIAGIGENGFDAVGAMVISKDMITQDYTIMLDKSDNLYSSELLNLTSVAAGGKEGFSVSYENGVATLTIYAYIQGNPPVPGAEVTISGVKMITDARGQVRFNLKSPGRYTAIIHASGYTDAEVVFNV